MFNKERGIIVLILNAVLIIWLLSATILTINNITNILIKDYIYTYEEYKISYCNFEYETEEECKNNYAIFKLDNKNLNVEYYRNIINSAANVILVSTTLLILNKKKIKNK